MTNNTAHPPAARCSDYSEETALEQCFNRLASVQQQGIQQKLQQMNTALSALLEELTQFLNTREHFFLQTR